MSPALALRDDAGTVCVRFIEAREYAWLIRVEGDLCEIVPAWCGDPVKQFSCVPLVGALQWCWDRTIAMIEARRPDFVPHHFSAGGTIGDRSDAQLSYWLRTCNRSNPIWHAADAELQRRHGPMISCVVAVAAGPGRPAEERPE